MAEPTQSTATPKNPRAESLFQHGNDAALKNNLDYAIQMYREACKLDPLNLIYRQALRGITRRKFGNDPQKVGMFASARLQPFRLRSRSERSRNHWERVLEICEEAFQLNPWDVTTARDAAEAADHLKAPLVAVWLVESVYSQGESDADFIRYSAQIYEKAKQFQKAIACWEKVRQLEPHDEQAKRQINALSASATIARAGLEAAMQKHEDRAAEVKASAAALDELKVAPETPEERLMREIREEPNRVRPYLELADHYTELKRLDEAEKVLAAGRKALPEDETLRTAYADLQIQRLRRALSHWTKKSELEPDNAEIGEKLSGIREKLEVYELNELRHRVKSEPANAQFRLELGRNLARLGRHDDAIAEFQQARSMGNTEVKRLSFELAGHAFEAKGLPKLAERSYQDALKLTDAEDQATVLNLHYRLGRVSETLGNLAEAEEHYNEVAATDYTYQDVAERLRALNQRRST